MTIGQAISIADENRPNAYSANLKILWLGELDGQIAAEVMLMSAEDQEQFNYSEMDDPMGAQLLVAFPYDSIYVKYLLAKIDEMNGEYENYGNNAAIFNDAYGAYSRWFSNTYDPAQDESDSPIYYISAYSLAVKQGFSGSIDEWLESLKGERGYRGDGVFIKYSETEPDEDSELTDEPSRWMGICVQNSELPAPESYTAYRWYDRGVRSDVRSFNGRSGAVVFSADDIPDGSVGSEKIENGAVGENQIADNAIAGEKIQSSAVTAGKIASNAVTAGKIASNAVTAGKIATGAVSAVYTASIPLWGVWVEDGDETYISVSVPGILATDEPIIDIARPTTAEDTERILEQWSYFIGAETEAGKVNFYVKEIPPHGMDTLPVRILCIRK